MDNIKQLSFDFFRWYNDKLLYRYKMWTTIPETLDTIWNVDDIDNQVQPWFILRAIRLSYNNATR